MPHQQANGCYIKTATLTWRCCSTKLIYLGLGGSHAGTVQYCDAKNSKEVGVTAQQAIERVVREEKLAGKGETQGQMVPTGGN